MADNKINVGGRLHSIATGNILAGADEILDDNKGEKQSVINAKNDIQLASHESRLNAYTEGKFVTVSNYSALPATGAVDTVYRVSSWDGTANNGQGAVDVTKYSEYAWQNGAYEFLDVKTQIGEVFDISAYHTTGGELAKYVDLTAALGTNGANVPVDVRRGGMSIKFVHSSDNKYMQYRFLLSDSFTDAQFANTYNWLSVEDEVLKQVGISISQTAALVVSESPQTIRVNFATLNKGTFKIAFGGGTSSALAIKVALYKDITNAQGFVYESGYFAFNQQIEYSGNEFNIAIFTVYANKVATAGDATVIIKTGLVLDIQNNRNAINDSEAKNFSTMIYTKGYLLSGSAIYDDNGLVIGSNVVWSDGITGTLTRSLWDDNALEYKRDIVSHGTQNVQYDRIYNYMGEVSKETITIN